MAWQGGLRPLERRLVEIFGVGRPVIPEKVLGDDDPRTAINVDGQVGRAVWWIEDSDRYMVHLFEGVYVVLPESNLREFTPLPPEEGGFDVAWPSHPEGYPEFTFALCRKLQRQGWCVVQMIGAEHMREDAVRLALGNKKFKPMREEFVTDYLGRDGRGKTAFLDTELPSPDQLEKLRTDALSLFDRTLTNMASLLAPFSVDLLGFPFGDRTKGMVWTPCANPKEEAAMAPEPLNDDDIEEGKLKDHINFITRRRLCLQTWLDNEGGRMTLIPRPDLDMDPVKLPLTTKKMLVFRSDRFSFRYEPVGRSVVLQAWLLQAGMTWSMNSVGGDSQTRAEAMGILVGRPHPEGDRVHIMAVQTRLPGGGSGAEEYWSMLLEGTDGEVVIPFQRWDTDIYCSKEGDPHVFGKCYARHGGFCAHHEIYNFDNKFFEIPDDEASFMSPSQRVVAEDGYTVLFKGGCSKESLRSNKMGVFLGDTGSDWTPFNPCEYNLPTGTGQVSRTYGPHPTAITGASNSVTASRLSHIFNMVGPVGTADTACSSSLVATGVAMSWLRPRMMEAKAEELSGRLKEAVAGGICVQIGPGSYIAMCGLNMISPNGRCFTFDESGDGYARGEGCGLMFLRASEDEKDMFSQVACLLGCSVNQDGRSASMTAPNGPSQQACIMASMREAGNEARDINLAECHGTGTALGDPIEVGALRNVMEPRDTTLALTSSKSNLGHLEGGAGIAGLLKCVLMLMAGTCPPNAHCRQLNPHLSVAGFPCYFDTEAIDTCMNSALTGVSSFGFGGTNGRCDIWGQARLGARKSGKLNMNCLDQLSVLCPITMGPIDYVTGEPSYLTERRGKAHADVLREEFAPYDISRYAYAGSFRYRRSEIPEEQPEDVELNAQFFICGSWSAYTEMEEMERRGGGWHIATLRLGETRCELFDICINQNKEYTLHPAIHKAGQQIFITGPTNKSEGKKWMIDGRDEQVPSGTVYQVSFKWSAQRMEILWRQVGEEDADLALRYEHTYYIAGTFSKGKCITMSSSHEEGTWEGFFRIGSQGKDEFQFVRDKDWKQVIYPAEPKAFKTGVPVRGPDDLGANKSFLVRGPPGEAVRVRLSVVDAEVTVSVTTDTKGTKEWRSIQGWERHQYSIIGTLNGGKPVPMEMERDRPGVFRCRPIVGQTYFPEVNGYLEFFQVAVDDDPNFVYHPAGNMARSGEFIVSGPETAHEGKSFIVKSLVPSRPFEVVLNLTAEDRRQIVTFGLVVEAVEDELAEQAVAGPLQLL